MGECGDGAGDTSFRAAGLFWKACPGRPIQTIAASEQARSVSEGASSLVFYSIACKLCTPKDTVCQPFPYEYVLVYQSAEYV